MCQVSLFFGNFGSGCESHSVGGVGGFVPFDPFFAMPAVTIAFKYEEQAMTNFSNFQWKVCFHEIWIFDDCCMIWCWSLIYFFQVVKIIIGFSNFLSQEWTHQFDLDLNASILDLKSALAFTSMKLLQPKTVIGPAPIGKGTNSWGEKPWGFCGSEKNPTW